ncbi:homoserine O-acetyltransferase [Klenkia marina]|uniref:Homoserine O-acetyltransferase n=1 Tax=Klenkia marina TaxID=1960309 RepID=A0A1G4XS83_9ACTN|nr:homoserine O-acetyltransferase [Klenkia marina]SCX44054.1 homoserine O-acetyltransferase [Klenkia marina]
MAAAWRVGDPPGDRRFADLAPLDLERGGSLPAVRVAYETWGSPSDPAVLVEHALTGDSHLLGPVGPGHPTPGWWEGLAGPLAGHFVVCANVLGGCQGTTGPADDAPDGRPWGARFPEITIADQVEVEARLAAHLGIERWAAVIGGSMGGMRALEWAVSRPAQVERLFFLASGAVATADQIGTQTTQQAAVALDPARGLEVARRIAHLTYRSAFELGTRFGNGLQDDGRFAVASYLEHHGTKLARRFDPHSYVLLTQAMNTWDVGRGRGGVEAALARVTARSLVAGIDSDRLYRIEEQQRVADALGVGLRVVESPYGHDGFLVEVDAVGDLVRELLAG